MVVSPSHPTTATTTTRTTRTATQAMLQQDNNGGAPSTVMFRTATPTNINNSGNMNINNNTPQTPGEHSSGGTFGAKLMAKESSIQNTSSEQHQRKLEMLESRFLPLNQQKVGFVSTQSRNIRKIDIFSRKNQFFLSFF